MIWLSQGSIAVVAFVVVASCDAVDFHFRVSRRDYDKCHNRSYKSEEATDRVLLLGEGSVVTELVASTCLGAISLFARFI